MLVYTMCFLTVSSRPCLETNPHSTLRTPFAGHCLGALRGGKPCPAELSEGVNRVLRTLSGDPPLPILQTPSAGHCLDTHGYRGFTLLYQLPLLPLFTLMQEELLLDLILVQFARLRCAVAVLCIASWHLIP